MLKGIPIAHVNVVLTEDAITNLQNELYVHDTETIKGNFSYGFRQLTEVGLKALSPGVNDPGTAIQVMRALFELYSYRLSHPSVEHVLNQDDTLRIIQNERTFEETFQSTILPIWDYGKNDRMVQIEFYQLLKQLFDLSGNKTVAVLLNEVGETTKAK